jgi:hypothetical protein
MANPAVQQTPAPARPKQSDLVVEGAAPTTPAAPPPSANRDLLEQKFGAERSKHICVIHDEVEKLHSNVRVHTHFFSKKDFESCAAMLNTCNQELAAALAKGDSKRYEEVLGFLKKQLTGLSSFIDYEAKEGLVGTTEGEVRVYVKNEKVWLCTPDAKAFSDMSKERGEELKCFVRAIAGVKIDIEKMKLQAENSQGEVQLLGCRLDSLTLLDSTENGKYEVVTMVRDGESFKAKTVRFTFKDLKAGRVPGVFGQDKPLPAVQNPNKATPNAEAAKQLTDKAIAEFERQLTFPARILPFPFRSPSSPKPPLAPEVAVAPATPALPGATKYFGTPEQQAALKQLDEHSALYKKLKAEVDNPNSTLPKADALKQLDDSQKAFGESVKVRRAQLQETIQNNDRKTAAHQSAQKYLKLLDAGEANTTLLRKQILEAQLAGTDDAVKATARTNLLQIAKKVDKAYATLLADDTFDATRRAELTAQRAAFSTQAKALEVAGKNGVQRFFGGIGQRLNSALATQIKLPSFSGVKGAVDWVVQKVVVADAAKTTAALAGSKIDDLNPAQLSKQSAQLETKAQSYRTQIKKLSDQVAKGDATKAETLAKLKEADATVTVRRAEMLEKQLAATTDPKAAAKIRQTLASEAAGVEGAYKHLGRPKDAADFLDRRKDVEDLVDRDKRLAANSGNKAVREATATRLKTEAQLAKATSGTAAHADLTAMHKLAVAKENVALVESELRTLKEAHAAAPTDELKNAITKKTDTLTQLQKVHVKEKVAFAQLQSDRVVAEFNAVEAKIKQGGHSPADTTKLHSERAELLKKKGLAAETLERIKTEGVSGPIKGELRALQKELADVEEALKKEANPAAKEALSKRATDLKSDVLAKRQQFLQSELDGTTTARNGMQQLAGELDKEIDGLKSAGKLKEAAELQKVRKAFDKQLAMIDETANNIKLKQAAVAADVKVDGLTKTRSIVQAEVDGLKQLGVLDDLQKAKMARLEATATQLDADLLKGRAEATAAQNALDNTLGKRLATSLKRFDVEVMPKFGAWAQKNPMKAARIVGALGEGLRQMGAASYDDDSKHTMIPAICFLLDSDLEDGFMGQKVQFTTSELGGPWMARAAEFMNGAGNFAVVMGGVKSAQWLGKGTLFLGSKLPVSSWAITKLTPLGAKVGGLLATQTAGRLLNGVGAAVDGFLTWSDYDSWKDDTADQLFTKTASPILLGAAFGSFFGPVGTVVGAAGGAIGELGGLGWALIDLNAKIEKDWRQRGTRESIKRAEAGMVYPADHPTLKTRSRDLNEHEKNAIEELVKGRLMYRLFGTKKDFSDDELTKLGFRLDESKEAGQHNYQRLTQLLEKQSNFLNFPNESEKAAREHNALFSKLCQFRIEDENYYRDRYHEAVRVAYEPAAIFSGDAPKRTCEMKEYFKSQSNKYVNAMAELNRSMDELAKTNNNFNRAALAPIIAEKQWEVMVTHFPQLGLQLATHGDRAGFFYNFKEATGIDLQQTEFWTHKSCTGPGMMFCKRYMPEELQEMPRKGLANPLSELDKLAEDLLKE